MAKLRFSELAETLIASEIVRLGATIKEKIRAGEHIYNYTIGDFDSAEFPIPDLLLEEIINSYKEGKRYTDYIKGDKMAKVGGLAALIAGGAGAAKVGILAKLLLIFKKIWILILKNPI